MSVRWMIQQTRFEAPLDTTLTLTKFLTHACLKICFHEEMIITSFFLSKSTTSSANLVSKGV